MIILGKKLLPRVRDVASGRVHVQHIQESGFDKVLPKIKYLVLCLVGTTGHGHSLRKGHFDEGISELVFRILLSQKY